MCENPSELDSSHTETSATICNSSITSSGKKQEKQFVLPENVEEMKDQELAVWSFDSAQDKCHDGSTSSPQVM